MDKDIKIVLTGWFIVCVLVGIFGNLYNFWLGISNFILTYLSFGIIMYVLSDCKYLKVIIAWFPSVLSQTIDNWIVGKKW